MKKLLLKRTGNILEKLGVVGVAMALLQSQPDMACLASVLILSGYLFAFWEAKS